MMNHSTDGHHSMAMPHMMMMKMYFHSGFEEMILFEKWMTHSVSAFVGSWFAIFLVAILYEGLKTLREMLSRRSLCRECAETHIRQQALIRTAEGHEYERPVDNDLIPTVKPEGVRFNRARLLSVNHVIQSLLHIVQMTISYLLMLVAMTFNSWLFFAIVLGAGVGHFLFAWLRSSVLDHNEHCN